MDSNKDQNNPDTVTIALDWDDVNAASDTYVFSNMSGADIITLGGGTITMPNVYITNTTSGMNWDSSLWGNDIKPNSTLSLNGENADIDINGVSLMETLHGIQERLNILCPDPDMEEEWDELRELRAQYEKKLAECREKSKMWKTLKS